MLFIALIFIEWYILIHARHFKFSGIINIENSIKLSKDFSSDASFPEVTHYVYIYYTEYFF